MRAASLAAALGRGEIEEEEGEEDGEQPLLSRASSPPSGLAAAAAEAEVEVEAGPAASAGDASSLSSSRFTELKRLLALRVAGARLDIPISKL